jgi:hypothetical protein
MGPWTCKRYVEVMPIGTATNKLAPAGSLPLETIQLRNIDGDRFRAPSEGTASTPLRCYVPSMSSPIEVRFPNGRTIARIERT